jgi:hypothetical protein
MSKHERDAIAAKARKLAILNSYASIKRLFLQCMDTFLLMDSDIVIVSELRIFNNTYSLRGAIY